MTDDDIHTAHPPMPGDMSSDASSAWVSWHRQLHQVTGLLALHGGKLSDSDLTECITVLTAVRDGMARELRERRIGECEGGEEACPCASRRAPLNFLTALLLSRSA